MSQTVQQAARSRLSKAMSRRKRKRRQDSGRKAATSTGKHEARSLHEPREGTTSHRELNTATNPSQSRCVTDLRDVRQALHGRVQEAGREGRRRDRCVARNTRTRTSETKKTDAGSLSVRRRGRRTREHRGRRAGMRLAGTRATGERAHERDRRMKQMRRNQGCCQDANRRLPKR